MKRRRPTPEETTAWFKGYFWATLTWAMIALLVSDVI